MQRDTPDATLVDDLRCAADAETRVAAATEGHEQAAGLYSARLYGLAADRIEALTAACGAAQEMYAELEREYGRGVANGCWPDLAPKMARWRAALGEKQG